MISKYLEENGYNVVSISGMGLVDNLQIGKVTQRELLDFIEKSKKND